MKENEKRYFLRNANIYEEIQKSKYSYCCCENNDYKRFDVMCNGYELITPNMIANYFEENPESKEVVIRVYTDEHIRDQFEEKKINLQIFKFAPFKHFVLKKKDFQSVFKKTSKNVEKIANCIKKITDLKEQIKENNRSIRFNKLNKELQEPYKQFNEQCEEEIAENRLLIKDMSQDFSTKIKDKLTEVLRSHWFGDTIKNGHFDLSHGQLTNTLVEMCMLLIDRFSKAGNWAGYSYIQDMKSAALVQLYEVALKFEELKSNNPFAYLTTVVSTKFTAILNSEKTQRTIKSTLLQEMGYDPTYTDQADMDYKLGSESYDMEHNLGSYAQETD